MFKAINTRKIYLVRHCKPQVQEGTHLCIGKKDIPLSDKGREQALQLVKYFSDYNINGIYSSPLKRAKETAEIVAGKEYNVVTKSNFSELDVGKWDGLSFDEVKQRYPEEYEERGNNLENYIVEGGESMAMCRKRAMAEMYKTINESAGDIVIVAHAGVIRTILSSLLGISMNKTFNYKIDYGSISILNYDDKILKPHEIGLSILK